MDTEREQQPIHKEIRALQAIVRLMERSDDDSRRRIMAYLNSRYPFYRWPI